LQLQETEQHVAKEQKPAGATPDVATPGKPAAATKRKKEFKKKRERRVIPHGLVHIAATFNNTQITITDGDGRVASRVRARARRTPRSKRRWQPRASRATSTA
jgi:small subunit ribosomal protein S11